MTTPTKKTTKDGTPDARLKQNRPKVESPNKLQALENYDPLKCPFSWDKLDGLLAYKSTCVMCADILEVGQTTIKEHIKLRYNMTFSEYSNTKLSRTRLKLVQKAIEQATSGNTVMLIFCLKNLLGWADKNEVANTNTEIKVSYPDERATKL